MKKVCYLLVTCSKEISRQKALEKVANSFVNSESWEKWKEDFYVFDNNSSVTETVDLLKSTFKNVFFAEENYGYWSAVSWFCKEANRKKYDFIYIIESDCVHKNIEQLESAINLLEEDNSIGMVRTAEFSLANKHLYDKDFKYPDSKTSEWFRQSNFFTGKSAFYEKTSIKDVYKTNLVAKVCGLHRITDLLDVMDKLSSIDWFTELDFQKIYHEKFKNNAILDGGMYNSSIAYEPDFIAGSLVKEKVDENGYRKTREGFITKEEEVKMKVSV